jgi:hypothetical protein
MIIEEIGFTRVNYNQQCPVEKGELWFALNMMPLEATKKGPWIDRPGYANITNHVTSSTLTVRAMGTFYSSAAGANVSFVVVQDTIAGGGSSDPRIYVGSTQKVAAADFTTAGIVVDMNAQLHWCEYNGQAVFCDGQNYAWMWDGTTDPGDGSTLTELTNGPATQVGKPTSYYSKLFFIKEDNTIVWSEEYQPNVGYEAGGYNNAWTLGQTSSAPIYALLGTNQGLWYFRGGSIGLIEGAVDRDFRTTGVHDGISDTVGSDACESVIRTGNLIWFVDDYGRPHVIKEGKVEEIWRQLHAWFKFGADDGPFSLRAAEYSPLEFDKVRATQSFVADKVCFWYPHAVLSGTSIRHYEICAVFDIETQNFCGWWTLGEATTFGGAGDPDAPTCMWGDYLGMTDTSKCYSVYATASTPHWDNFTGGASPAETAKSHYDRRIIFPPTHKGMLVGNVDRVDVIALASFYTDATTVYRRNRVRLPQANAPDDVGMAAAGQPASKQINYLNADFSSVRSTGYPNDRWGAWVKTSFNLEARARWVAVDLVLQERGPNGDHASYTPLGVAAIHTNLVGVDEEPDET